MSKLTRTGGQMTCYVVAYDIPDDKDAPKSINSCLGTANDSYSV